MGEPFPSSPHPPFSSSSFTSQFATQVVSQMTDKGLITNVAGPVTLADPARTYLFTLETSYQYSIISYQFPQSTDYWLLATGYWLLATDH